MRREKINQAGVEIVEIKEKLELTHEEMELAARNACLSARIMMQQEKMEKDINRKRDISEKIGLMRCALISDAITVIVLLGISMFLRLFF